MNKILLVEDNPGDVRLLEVLLQEGRKQLYSLQHVDSLQKAVAYLTDKKADVVLLDLSLPDCSGLESVRLLRAASPSLPIVILTGTNDDQVALESLQIGAQDYLVKGDISSGILWRCMKYAVERKKMEEQLQYLAMHDNLTGLPNRALFQDRLTQSIERAKRQRNGANKHCCVAVILLDLDNFKYVNDTFGHPEGDKLLRQIADRLRTTVRQSDTVARMGGDEFMLIFENVRRKEDLDTLGNKILQVFSLPFQLSEQTIQTTASVGISLFPHNGEDFKALMQTADIAMYHAKQSGNCFYSYHQGVEEL